jgi:peptidoglycan/xylan/chitin deacetylase (PgdA/CDA1 family)
MTGLSQNSGGGNAVMSRRAMLRLAGTGTLIAAGGAVLAGCSTHQPSTSAQIPADTVALPPPKALHLDRVSAVWSQNFQTGHRWYAAGAGTASANLNDTSLFTRGTQSARSSTNGSGRQSAIRARNLPPIDLTGKMIRLIFRVDDTSHLHKVAFYLGSRDLANSYVWQVHTHTATSANYVQSGEWVTVHLQWADVRPAAGSYTVSPAGIPSVTSGFTAMSFAVYDDAGGPVAYRLQTVEALADTKSIFPHGAVSITFDDSFQSVSELAYPIMKAHGFAGTVYNIAQAVGTKRYLTLPQMRTLQDSAGWEMAGHAYATAAHNAGYNKLTSAQVDDDFGRLRGWMTANGFTSEHFAYPHGAFQATSDGKPVDQIASRHFTTARSIISETVESLAPAMPHRLKAITGINDGTGLGGAALTELTAPGAKLDRCAHNSDWLILAFHDITAATPTASTQISRAGFTTVMEAIAAKGIPVVTVSRALERFS